MKNDRQLAIAAIISKHNIDKQDILISLLKEAGYDAAQATVSRDLRQMNVSKVNDGNGGMKYALPPANSDQHFSHYTSAFASSILSVDYALNNVVIKTHTGMANAVAVGMDSVSVSEILGCVAGDDTIIVVTRTPEDAGIICENIQRMVVSARNKN